MKRFIFIASLLISSICYGQSIGYLRFDTVKIMKQGGNAELIIQNATRAVTGGVLTNMGNGRTAFVALAATTTFEGALNNGSAMTVDHVVTATGQDFVWQGFDDIRFDIDSFYIASLGFRNDTSTQKILTWNTSTGSFNISNWLNALSANNGTSLSGSTVQLGHIYGSSVTDIASNAARQLKIDTSTFWFKGVEIAAVPAFRNQIGIRLSDSTTRGPAIVSLGGMAIDNYMVTAAAPGAPSWNVYIDGTFNLGIGYHFVLGEEHAYMDMRDDTRYFAFETGSGTSMALFGTALSDHITQLGLKGPVALGNIATTATLGWFHNPRSTYLGDTVKLVRKLFITDSTGYDIVMSQRASPYVTKMMTVPDLRTLLGISGATTWNSITDPTGDQALTFQAGESSTWTNQNTTEDLFTINGSTMTNSKVIAINSTSTAKTNGNAIISINSTGANATSGITVTGDSVSVRNTGTTSTNRAIWGDASGATVNIGVQGTPNIIAGSPTLDVVSGIISQSRSNTSNEGIRVYFNNGTANAMYGPQGLLASSSYIIDAPSGFGLNYSGTRKATQLSTGQFRFGDANTSPIAWVNPAAGTTAVPPFGFIAGTNTTVAVSGALEFDGTDVFGTNSTAVRGTVIIMRSLSSAAASLTLAYTYTDYLFTGTTTTWTLPAVSATNHTFYIKNAGSGTITLNSSAGGNDIYSTSAVNTIAVAAGTAVNLRSIASIFYVE